MTKPVKEYIKAVSDYEGSPLQKQIEALEAEYKANTDTKSSSEGGSVPQKKEPVKQAPSEPEIDFNDEIPF